MTTLRATQRRLAAEILGNARGESAVDDGFAEHLRLPPGIAPDTRLAIYRDGYPARILDALRDGFPAIANICGDGSFTNLVRRYLRDCDVSSTTLNDIGQQLPRHCEHDPLVANLPFLADLARLEWTVLRAFHSRDLPVVDPSTFAAWDMADWERAVLSFQPSMALLQSPWPLHDLWETRETPRTEIDLDLTDRPQSVLVYRQGYDVACAVIATTQHLVLDALIGGAPLGSALEAMADAAEAEEDTSQMFASWLGKGLITAVRILPEGPSSPPS